VVHMDVLGRTSTEGCTTSPSSPHDDVVDSTNVITISTSAPRFQSSTTVVVSTHVMRYSSLIRWRIIEAEVPPVFLPLPTQ